MNLYPRSICSTCRHTAYCALTANKFAVSSCSEYVHLLDKDIPGHCMVSLEMINNPAEGKVVII